HQENPTHHHPPSRLHARNQPMIRVTTVDWVKESRDYVALTMIAPTFISRRNATALSLPTTYKRSPLLIPEAVPQRPGSRRGGRKRNRHAPQMIEKARLI